MPPSRALPNPSLYLMPHPRLPPPTQIAKLDSVDGDMETIASALAAKNEALAEAVKRHRELARQGRTRPRHRSACGPCWAHQLVRDSPTKRRSWVDQGLDAAWRCGIGNKEASTRADSNRLA